MVREASRCCLASFNNILRFNDRFWSKLYTLVMDNRRSILTLHRLNLSECEIPLSNGRSIKKHRINEISLYALLYV